MQSIHPIFDSNYFINHNFLICIKKKPQNHKNIFFFNVKSKQNKKLCNDIPEIKLNKKKIWKEIKNSFNHVQTYIYFYAVKIFKRFLLL